jgi:class 3 adenylate cyclase/tetratricopeptide (TPR) repeat protein
VGWGHRASDPAPAGEGSDLICPNCGTPNEAGRKFCGECGTKLALACPSCGAANPPNVRFCGDCGARLDTAVAGAPAATPAGVGGVVTEVRHTERRVVSVLFADLVGFTTRTDGQDPEQVREFLARYFEVAREVVERFGGVVEKFIGDAVMAVWGARAAREDDAERAVRAALDLVDSVALMGRLAGDETLALRAGVLTGEAAVNVDGTDQALVAGDLVNTASRLQSVAPPGTVLVGEGTYRLADRAIAFQPAGEQLLKGKAAPVPAWRALRVVAERGGLGRSEGIEAPFVGRDDELRLLKNLLHATGRERRIRLVSVTGQAGMGKSRLAWEFLKYIDGVAEPIYWHQGRSPAFGEGVTFWALGEMVRRRAKLAEGDDEATTRARIAEMLVEYVPDETERIRLEPVLLALLGVGELGGGAEELFPSLRILFERISIQGTTVLAFEDLQWADAGVIEFINHLLEWSIGYPILIVTLARPELLERQPDWGAGRRDFVGLSLGPLDEAAMRSMLLGLVPDLPERALRSVLARADGIPLYAVEMVRMLTADGRLEEDEGFYRVVGDLGDVRVPDTLHSLIASRLDGLEPIDRAVIQDASVLGQTFDVAALSAISGHAVADLETRLRPMVRRELLRLDTDPRSPERGQYGFTQALFREVAYGTLSKADRRAKHLAAARYFESLGDDEVAGVLATHYVDAWAAAPSGPDGEAVAGQARIALRAAAERAINLGSLEQATALLRRALEVTADPREEGELLERIGVTLRDQGRYDDAFATLREAVDRARARGDRIGAARATALLGTSLNAAFRANESAEILRAAVEEFDDLAPDPAITLLWSIYARAIADLDEAAAIRYADRALADAERHDLVRIVADALVTKGSVLAFSGRWREGTGLLDIGQRIATAQGLPLIAGRAANNLAGALIETDPERAVQVGRDGVALARRYGLRGLLVGTLANTIEASLPLGQWDWIDDEIASIRLDDLEPVDRISLLVGLGEIEAVRGRDVSDVVAELETWVAGTSDPTAMSAIEVSLAIIAAAQGRFEDSFRRAVRSADLAQLNEPGGMSLATSDAILLRDLARARTSLARIEGIGARGRGLQVDVLRYRAAIRALEGDPGGAGALYQDAWRQLRELRLTFSLARSQLEYLAVMPGDDPGADAVAAQARETLTALGARAYLTQLDQLLAARVDARADRPATARAQSEAVVSSAGEPAG